MKNKHVTIPEPSSKQYTNGIWIMLKINYINTVKHFMQIGKVDFQMQQW